MPVVSGLIMSLDIWEVVSFGGVVVEEEFDKLEGDTKGNACRKRGRRGKEKNKYEKESEEGVCVCVNERYREEGGIDRENNIHMESV